jgi:hypothetical protein
MQIIGATYCACSPVRGEGLLRTQSIKVKVLKATKSLQEIWITSFSIFKIF